MLLRLVIDLYNNSSYDHRRLRGICYKEITLSDPYAEFNAESDVTCDFKWEFNYDQKSEGIDVIFLIQDKGSYPVRLRATSQNGCSIEVHSSFVAYRGRMMIVENSFTPDNNSVNEKFLPKDLTVSNVEFTFSVYDQNHRLVFETNDKYDGWNGNLNNSGNPMPMGTYSWKVSFTDDRGKEHHQGGKINLLR